MVGKFKYALSACLVLFLAIGGFCFYLYSFGDSSNSLPPQERKSDTIIVAGQQSKTVVRTQKSEPVLKVEDAVVLKESKNSINFDDWKMSSEFIQKFKISDSQAEDVQESLLLMKAKLNELELNNLHTENLTNGKTSFRISPFPNEGKLLLNSFWDQLDETLGGNKSASDEIRKSLKAIGVEERYDFGGQETLFVVERNPYSKGYTIEQTSFSGPEVITTGMPDARPVGTEVLSRKFSFSTIPDKFLHLFERPESSGAKAF